MKQLLLCLGIWTVFEEQLKAIKPLVGFGNFSIRTIFPFMHLLNASDRSSENASGELPYVSTYYCPFLIQLVQLYIHAMADPAIGVASFYPSEARLRIALTCSSPLLQSTTLRDSHDCGILLQHKIEMLEEVERCFVHIDYQMRLHDDHDPEVPIDAKLYGGPCRSSPRAEGAKLAFQRTRGARAEEWGDEELTPCAELSGDRP
ncbi:unnamed protein product [Durusdinium trenchii]|uniref:Uncharacterized protein n=1 Tax=Durusdinium trenchii TaxID=1381693 RepID=A0ABP0MWJ6_9DINO